MVLFPGILVSGFLGIRGGNFVNLNLGRLSYYMINLFVENEVTHNDTPVLVRTLSWP